jgi:hypothetical protein
MKNILATRSIQGFQTISPDTRGLFNSKMGRRHGSGRKSCALGRAKESDECEAKVLRTTNTRFTARDFETIPMDVNITNGT